MSLGPEYTISKIFEKDVVLNILDVVKQIEEPRWVSRTRLSYGRGINGASCSYDFCGQQQMKIETRKMLENLAPKYTDYPLAEVAVNRYKVNDYLGKHRDRHYYRKNLVIALQELGDGLYIDDTDEYIEDMCGQGFLIDGIGPAHSVPPVKNLRYTLIYLYE